MANWSIRNSTGVTLTSCTNCETISYTFPKNTGTTHINYLIYYTGDTGCATSKTIYVPSGSTCNTPPTQTCSNHTYRIRTTAQDNTTGQGVGSMITSVTFTLTVIDNPCNDSNLPEGQCDVCLPNSAAYYIEITFTADTVTATERFFGSDLKSLANNSILTTRTVPLNNPLDISVQVVKFWNVTQNTSYFNFDVHA